MCVKRWGYTNEPKSGLAGSGLPTWPHVKDDLMQYIFPGEERPEPAGVSLGPTLAWDGCREKLVLTLEHSLCSQSPQTLSNFLDWKIL